MHGIEAWRAYNALFNDQMELLGQLGLMPAATEG
jgi:hypothetical protein